MYIGEKYKEGIIYQKDGSVMVKIQCKVTASDESIYNGLKALCPLVNIKEPLFRINTVFKNIMDEAPANTEETQPSEVTFEDTFFTIPKGEFIIDNMIFTDEDIYGDALDGENRRYRVIWVDEAGEEHFVPLEGFDVFEAENPHGQYSYNSETKQLIFSAFMPFETTYIMRRYYYNE